MEDVFNITSSLAGVSKKQMASMLVEGQVQCIDAIREWGDMTAFITTFTSAAIAKAVLNESLRHTPEDKGDLIASAYTDTVAGGNASVERRLKLTAVDENLEGTEDYAAVIPTFQESFMARNGNFGQQYYCKYVAGYSSDHAAVTHEVAPPNGFRQPSEGTRTDGHKMQYPDNKTTHYLLNAYNNHRDVFSAAMKRNIEHLSAQFAAAKARQIDPYKGRNLGTSGGPLAMPRLIKKPR